MSKNTRTQDDVITINERYSIWRDQYQWFLYDFKNSRLTPDGSKLRKLPQPTYHPKLTQLVDTLIEETIRSIDADSLTGLYAETCKMRAIMEQTLQLLTRDLEQTPADQAEKRND